jgi:hypothetical protein
MQAAQSSMDTKSNARLWRRLRPVCRKPTQARQLSWTRSRWRGTGADDVRSARPHQGITAIAKHLFLPSRQAAEFCGLVLALSAFPMALSAGESETPDLTGIWSGIYTTPADSRWQLADFACPVGCGAEFYSHLQALLADPSNDAYSFAELEQASKEATPTLSALLTTKGQVLHAQFVREQDPSIRCEPKGLGRQATNPLPMAIHQDAERISIRYEQWQAVRTIHLHSEASPSAAPSLLGYSIGRYEDNALVVETTALTANILTSDGVPHSDQLHIFERYSLADSGDRLELELTLLDPVMFSVPVVLTKAWLRTPQDTILAEACEVISGQP